VRSFCLVQYVAQARIDHKICNAFEPIENNGQSAMQIKRLIVIERDLLAFLRRGLLTGRGLRLAMPVGCATSLRRRPHKEVFAGDAAAPYQHGG